MTQKECSGRGIPQVKAESEIKLAVEVWLMSAVTITPYSVCHCLLQGPACHWVHVWGAGYSRYQWPAAASHRLTACQVHQGNQRLVDWCTNRTSFGESLAQRQMKNCGNYHKNHSFTVVKGINCCWYFCGQVWKLKSPTVAQWRGSTECAMWRADLPKPSRKTNLSLLLITTALLFDCALL